MRKAIEKKQKLDQIQISGINLRNKLPQLLSGLHFINSNIPFSDEAYNVLRYVIKYHYTYHCIFVPYFQLKRQSKLLL